MSHTTIILNHLLHFEMEKIWEYGEFKGIFICEKRRQREEKWERMRQKVEAVLLPSLLKGSCPVSLSPSLHYHSLLSRTLALFNTMINTFQAIIVKCKRIAVLIGYWIVWR